MEEDAAIYVAGAHTVVGRALVRALRIQGFTNILPAPDKEEAELTDGRAVDGFFRTHRPQYVFFCGVKSGGIGANQKYPADLSLANILAEAHVISSAFRHGVAKLLYLASACVYPRLAPQPMRPDSLMTGAFEPTSQSYAVAKLAGIELCQAYRRQFGAPFIVGIEGNEFGPDDEFSPENSHVIAALIRRMHEAKVGGRAAIEIWGSGAPRRDFIFADDLADACIFAMRHYNGHEPINLSGGADISIRELAEQIREIVGFDGELVFDAAKPDGAPVKLLDVEPLFALGWRPKMDFRHALALMYESFIKNH